MTGFSLKKLKRMNLLENTQTHFVSYFREIKIIIKIMHTVHSRWNGNLHIRVGCL